MRVEKASYKTHPRAKHKLSPLKKLIEQCEAKIMKLEEAIKTKNEALIAYSSSNDVGELGQVKELKSDEEALETLYEQFESLHHTSR